MYPKICEKSTLSMKTSAEFLSGHLKAIARPRDIVRNRQSLLEVENYVETRLSSYGYSVRKSPFPFQGHVFNNIIASQDEDCQPRLIVGAHFDAVEGTEGADDNASGVAALLEAARILADSKQAANVIFAAYNAEEYGFVGSSHHASQLIRSGTKLEGMISLEMVGFTSREKGSQKMPVFLRPFYPDTGNFLALVGDSRSKPFLEKAKKAFQTVEGLPVETLTLPAKGWIFPEARLSDHSPFWDAGFPALLVTDTSFFRNPHYHLPSDRIETLDLEFLAQVTEGVVRLASSLGGG